MEFLSLLKTKYDVITRLDSTYTMLSRVVYVHKAIEHFLVDEDDELLKNPTTAHLYTPADATIAHSACFVLLVKYLTGAIPGRLFVPGKLE